MFGGGKMKNGGWKEIDIGETITELESLIEVWGEGNTKKIFEKGFQTV